MTIIIVIPHSLIPMLHAETLYKLEESGDVGKIITPSK